MGDRRASGSTVLPAWLQHQLDDPPRASMRQVPPCAAVAVVREQNGTIPELRQLAGYRPVGVSVFFRVRKVSTDY